MRSNQHVFEMCRRRFGKRRSASPSSPGIGRRRASRLARVEPLENRELLAAAPLISEFMANNANILSDADGHTPDWFEVYNAGDAPIDLAGWHATDDPLVPDKWTFPSTVIAAGKWITVFASGENRAVSGQPLHTNFQLDADGDYLALVGSDGSSVVSEYAPQFPPQIADVSYGLTPSGTKGYFTSPTPGAANGVANTPAIVADTQFSTDRGFFDSPFSLTLYTETVGAQIRYTTDGSAPTASSGSIYSAPLTISKTTAVRAAAFNSGMLPSNVDTQTFVFVNDVVLQSPAGQAPTGWPTTWGPSQKVDYGMDPEIVNNPAYTQQLKDGLKAIPSIALTIKLGDLFDGATGIYANALQDGAAWERPVSVELIRPDGGEGFQQNGGLRIRGGDSRNPQNPKHSFRLFFRSEYEGDLRYPLFGPDGPDSISKFDLRVDQVVSWANRYASSWGVYATMLRDLWDKDAALAAGEVQPAGDIYHVYINGQYWGIYNTEERPETDFSTAHFGASEGGYDTILPDADNDFQIRATDGDMAAWTQTWNLANAGLTSTASYQRIQGNNPDGTRNPAYPVLVDVDNLIDYMLANQYAANFDGPIAYFLNNVRPRNFFMTRPRDGSHGFRFFMHDMEHTLLDIPGSNFTVNASRIGPYTAGNLIQFSNPQWLWQKFNQNADFRLRQADRMHQLFFNGGIYTPARATEIYQERVNQINQAIVGESARWGDAQVAAPFTKNDWIAANNTVINGFFPFRTGVVLTQFRNAGLYPSVAAPEFSPQHGGSIDAPFPLTILRPGGAGTIYYTLDGSDPRLPDGTVRPTATAYSSPVTLDQSRTVKARILSASVWSALLSADFSTNISAFKIAEVMYNPAPAPAGSPYTLDDFEFIELVNTSPNPLNVGGSKLSQGVTFQFPSLILAAGARTLVVRNAAAMASRYGAGLPIAGEYAGLLSNDGEGLTLTSLTDEIIASFTYSDSWYPHTDGEGYSLVAIDPTNPALDLNFAGGWRPSNLLLGGPGQVDPGVDPGTVVINEAVSNPSAGADWVELHNTSAAPIDVSGWYLSNSKLDLRKYTLPAGSVIAAHGYLVVSGPFDLSAASAEIYLSNCDAGGAVAGYREFADFAAADRQVAFGRYVTSTGKSDFTALTAPTPGAANAGPLVGPAVFSEVMYHPPLGGMEYIELSNLTSTAVPLFDPANPGTPWKFSSGIEYAFPAGATIPASGGALVVGGDPAAFRAAYSVPAGVPIFGPFSGSLANDGEDLKLARPLAPLSGAAPYALVDKLKFDDDLPWPIGADGGGSSLSRANLQSYGNDPANWAAAAPSPGNFSAAPAGISLIASGSLQTTEGGGGAVFSVVLDRAPTANVTINLATSDSSEGTVSPGSLVFTPANWYLAQSATVVGQDDAVADGDVSYQVQTQPAISSDANYSARNAADVTLINRDDDVPATLWVTNADDSGPGSLRAAILAANASFGVADTLGFAIAGAGPHSISLAAPLPPAVDPLTLDVAAGDEVQIGVASAYSLDALAGWTKTGEGKLVIGGAQSYAAGTTIDDAAGLLVLASDAGPNATVLARASLSITANQHLAGLQVASGASVVVQPGGRLLRTPNLSINAGGSLDLTDGALIVQGTAANRMSLLSELSAQIAAGAHNLAWDGPGIRSSIAAADGTFLSAVGIMLNDNGLGAPFHEQFAGEAVDADSILVRFTYYGDADLTGVVDGTDYALTDNGFNARLVGWFNGDFDYNALVEGTDYALIDNAFNSLGAPQAASQNPPAAVDPRSPETVPTGLPGDPGQRGVVRAWGSGEESKLAASPVELFLDDSLVDGLFPTMPRRRAAR